MIELWAPLCIGAIIVIYVLVDKLGSGAADASEIALLLRHVDFQFLAELFDPDAEAKLRAELPLHGFRLRQRHRILAAIEQTRRIRHNARIVRAWGDGRYREICRIKHPARMSDDDRLARNVIQAADDVKAAASNALIKLLFWRLTLIHIWPFLPSPSLSDVRDGMGADLIVRYEEMVSCTGTLLMAEGGDKYELVRAAL